MLGSGFRALWLGLGGLGLLVPGLRFKGELGA